MRPTHQLLLLFHNKLFKASPFNPSQELKIFLRCLFTTCSYLIWEWPVFCLVQDGWLTRWIFDILSSFICRTCPSNLNLSLIITIESGIVQHVSYCLQFEIRSVRRVPKTIFKQFLWKISNKFSSVFQSTQDYEPYLTAVTPIDSNILFLIRRLISLFFQTFITCRKILGLGYSSFNIFTAPYRQKFKVVLQL